MPMSFVGKNDGNVKLLLPNQQQWGRGVGQWEWLRLRRQERAVQRESSAEAKRVEARRTDRAWNKEERGKGRLQR